MYIENDLYLWFALMFTIFWGLIIYYIVIKNKDNFEQKYLRSVGDEIDNIVKDLYEVADAIDENN